MCSRGSGVCLQKKKKDDEEGEESKQQVPRMYLTFKGRHGMGRASHLLLLILLSTDCHTYQLRAYLYQARDMHSSDKSGLSGMHLLSGGVV